MHRTARIYLAGDEHFHSEIELTHEIHVTSGEVAMRFVVVCLFVITTFSFFS